ncbi:hypothetical protein GCM10011378_04410 [Hymenobacter glacieicola]|uniref:ABC transmembrane type-1 domain-containing protein n=1 Tax=Hymenobacter glacieicola TaxID=1562124 RepID=A0ABQ1WIV3_9BACT|nr:hypothetical protein GCM10011378_04410 [Hymenobacter glacieicola]
MAGILVAAFLAPTSIPTPDLLHTTQAPFQAGHWLGTDPQGLDVGVSLLQGSRTVVLSSVPAAILTLLLGAVLGSAAGFWRNRALTTVARVAVAVLVAGLGLLFLPQLLAFPLLGSMLLVAAGALMYWPLRRAAWAQRSVAVPLDSLLMGAVNLLDSIPILILVIGVAAMQRPSATGTIALLALTCWTTAARIMRTTTLQIAARPYVEAARMVGLTNFQLLRRHIWPNTWPLLALQLPLTVAALIGLETTLSFLGVGFSPDIPSWGKLLSTVRQAPTAWWLALWPGLALAGTIVSLHSLAGLGANRSDVTK